jgi:hypothetical protein
VSQFAAGCAVCGTDLEVARASARRPVRVADHIPRVDDSFLWAAVVGLIVLAMPVLGGLLAVYGIYSANLSSQARVRWVFVALAVVAAGLFVSPATRYGVVWMFSA